MEVEEDYNETRKKRSTLRKRKILPDPFHLKCLWIPTIFTQDTANIAKHMKDEELLSSVILRLEV
jgi:hypothetical protein